MPTGTFGGWLLKQTNRQDQVGTLARAWAADDERGKIHGVHGVRRRIKDHWPNAGQAEPLWAAAAGEFMGIDMTPGAPPPEPMVPPWANPGGGGNEPGQEQQEAAAGGQPAIQASAELSRVAGEIGASPLAQRGQEIYDQRIGRPATQDSEPEMTPEQVYWVKQALVSGYTIDAPRHIVAEAARQLLAEGHGGHLDPNMVRPLVESGHLVQPQPAIPPEGGHTGYAEHMGVVLGDGPTGSASEDLERARLAAERDRAAERGQVMLPPEAERDLAIGGFSPARQAREQTRERDDATGAERERIAEDTAWDLPPGTRITIRWLGTGQWPGQPPGDIMTTSDGTLLTWSEQFIVISDPRVGWRLISWQRVVWVTPGTPAGIPVDDSPDFSTYLQRLRDHQPGVAAPSSKGGEE